VTAAAATGLSGCSIEDFTRDRNNPIYEFSLAVDRVRAAAEAGHAGGPGFVLTARCENYLHGRIDLADTIRRLQAYQEAGADVLFAPRVIDPAELRTLLAEVDRPVNVLILPDAPDVGELAELGVARISVGGGFAWSAMAGLIDAARELLDHGTTGWWSQVANARDVVRAAFTSPR
jgi:2-methylisocitrate lyase-like PEP mutase family enzyme